MVSATLIINLGEKKEKRKKEKRLLMDSYGVSRNIDNTRSSGTIAVHLFVTVSYIQTGLSDFMEIPWRNFG